MQKFALRINKTQYLSCYLNLTLYYSLSTHMTNFLRNLFSVICVTIWIALSEFIINEIIYKHAWQEQYEKMGLLFPQREYLWVFWNLIYACFIFVLARKFRFMTSTIIVWLTGLAFMWLINADVVILPREFLIGILPLSFLESFVAGYILRLFNRRGVTSDNCKIRR